jgi:hypothetical protein
MEKQTAEGTLQLTKGQYRIGSFNPGGHAAVNSIKQKAAALIDEIEEIASLSNNGEVKRLCAVAQTEIESAAMWAIKAATKPAQ